MDVRNREFTLVLFIIILFSIQTPVNLALPHPVQGLVLSAVSGIYWDAVLSHVGGEEIL